MVVTDDGNIDNQEAEVATSPKNNRRGRMTTLTQANIDRLNDVGFKWTYESGGRVKRVGKFSVVSHHAYIKFRPF